MLNKKKAYRLMFENYIDCLFNNKIILKSQQRFKSDHHNVYAEQINKITLGSNDDERLQRFDKTAMDPHGTNAFKVCESEVIIVKDLFLENNRVFCFMIKSYYNDNKDKRLQM